MSYGSFITNALTDHFGAARLAYRPGHRVELIETIAAQVLTALMQPGGQHAEQYRQNMRRLDGMLFAIAHRAMGDEDQMIDGHHIRAAFAGAVRDVAAALAAAVEDPDMMPRTAALGRCPPRCIDHRGAGGTSARRQRARKDRA